MEWNGEKWILVDQADFVAVKGDKPVPPNNKTFFMLWEQNARLESYSMVDGPLPEHFEPFESPCDDNPLNGAFHNPCAFGTQYASTKQGTKEQYPIVATTYSCLLYTSCIVLRLPKVMAGRVLVAICCNPPSRLPVSTGARACASKRTLVTFPCSNS